MAQAGLCFKCKEGRSFAPSRDGKQKPYCRACFTKYVENAAREAFFRQCGVPTDVPVVLAISGGAGSTALCHIVGRIRADNLNRGGQGKIVYDVSLLHLNEQCVASSTASASDSTFALLEANARQAAEACGLPLTVLNLRDLLAPSVVAAIHGAASLTDREDLYYLARRGAILNAACALGARAAVFGDTATTSAWRSLGEIVRSRGEHTRTACGFHGLVPVGPSREMFVFRPMRGVLAKEVALYCRAQSLPWTYTPSPATGTNLRSIDRTLEAFVVVLEGTFRSTVFNILNSVDRMGPQADRAALARGSSTVTTRDGGKRALKQHLHEVITGMLRGAVGSIWGTASSSSAREPNDDGAGNADDHAVGDSGSAGGASGVRTCAACGMVLKRHRAEGPAAHAGSPLACEPTTSDSGSVCRGCEAARGLLTATSTELRASAEDSASSHSASVALGVKTIDEVVGMLP